MQTLNTLMYSKYVLYKLTPQNSGEESFYCFQLLLRGWDDLFLTEIFKVDWVMPCSFFLQTIPLSFCLVFLHPHLDLSCM